MEDQTPKRIPPYRITISRTDPGKPTINRSYMLSEALCRQLTEGKRIIVEIEDGDYIKATMKEEEDDQT
jgi:hypothetical protein